MSMSLQITGDPITLDALRELVQHTHQWPGDSVVRPKGSRTELASITVSQPEDTLPLPPPTE